MTKRNLFSVGRLALFPLILACTGEDDGPAPVDAAEIECQVDLDCNRLGPGSDRPGSSLEPSDEGYRYCDVGIPEIEVDNRCTTCLAAASRSGVTVDVGCLRGEECIGSRCVAIEATCVNETAEDGNIELECPEGRKHCVLGQCVECETAADCPFFGGDNTCFAVRCNLGWCAAENVCTCESSVECNDGDDCTQDFCEADSQECIHTVLPSCPTAAAPPPTGGGGGGGVSPPADTGSITVTWTVASGTFSNATLSAQIAGGPMLPRNTQANASSITSTIAGVPRGATVDVSVEYTQGGGTSNSCVMSSGALTPNGAMTATATTGTPPAFTQVPNGTGGCNRRTTLP